MSLTALILLQVTIAFFDAISRTNRLNNLLSKLRSFYTGVASYKSSVSRKDSLSNILKASEQANLPALGRWLSGHVARMSIENSQVETYKRQIFIKEPISLIESFMKRNGVRFSFHDFVISSAVRLQLFITVLAISICLLRTIYIGANPTYSTVHLMTNFSLLGLFLVASSMCFYLCYTSYEGQKGKIRSEINRLGSKLSERFGYYKIEASSFLSQELLRVQNGLLSEIASKFAANHESDFTPAPEKSDDTLTEPKIISSDTEITAGHLKNLPTPSMAKKTGKSARAKVKISKKKPEKESSLSSSIIDGVSRIIQ